MLKVRVKSGKMLKQHITDGEDEFLETGAIVSVTRAFYDQHMRSRVFDSYHRSDGAILDRPEVRNDPTIELVEDPVEVHNKSISKAA